MFIAKWNDMTIAQAEDDKIIHIEGNAYFPLSAVKQEYLKENSELHTTCHWKGSAHYYDLVVDGEVNEGAVFQYPEPKEGSVDRVGQDYSQHVAFWHGVAVEQN